MAPRARIARFLSSRPGTPMDTRPIEPGSLETSNSLVLLKKTILSHEDPVTRHSMPAASQSELTVNCLPRVCDPVWMLARILTFGKKAGSIFRHL
jgi:hypothetical protein